jgi:hypothetical protein
MPIVKAASRELHLLLWRILIIWKSRKQSIIVCLRSRAAHIRRAHGAVGAKRSNDRYLYRSSGFGAFVGVVVYWSKAHIAQRYKPLNFQIVLELMIYTIL